MLRTPHNRQIAKYLITGGCAFAADYITFLVLYGFFHSPLAVASTTSMAGGFAISFILNRLWVFGAKSANEHKTPHKQLALYAVLFICNTIFTYLFIKFAITIEVSAYFAKLCTIVLI
ncbi:MAG: GtrA family protein, partial [Chitinophagaceae bacterium]